MNHTMVHQIICEVNMKSSTIHGIDDLKEFNRAVEPLRQINPEDWK